MIKKFAWNLALVAIAIAALVAVHAVTGSTPAVAAGGSGCEGDQKVDGEGRWTPLPA